MERLGFLLGSGGYFMLQLRGQGGRGLRISGGYFSDLGGGVDTCLLIPIQVGRDWWGREIRGRVNWIYFCVFCC